MSTHTSLSKRPFRYRWALPVLVVALMASACNRGGDDTAEAEEPVRIGFVQAHMTSSFRTQMIEGAEEAAERLGAELTVFNSNNEVIKQNEAIDNFATQGFDVIAVAAIELESVLPAIHSAAEAGSTIIAVDTIIDDDAVSAQVGVDNAAGGETMGEFVADYAQENGIEATVGVVGALNSEIQNVRKDSFADVITAGGGSITQTVDGQNRQEIALASAENLFTSYPGLPIVYATGEPALVGTLAAAQSQGIANELEIFGWDLSQETIAAIDAGQVVAVAHQPAHQEGVSAVETAVKIHDGKEFEKDQLVPIEVVTSENIDDYRSIFQ